MHGNALENTATKSPVFNVLLLVCTLNVWSSFHTVLLLLRLDHLNMLLMMTLIDLCVLTGEGEGDN